MTLKEVDIAAEEERKMEHSFVNQYAVQVVSSSYNASDAVSYARKWAKDRNTAYNSYTSDCTNFVSQAAHAGGISMKKPNTIKHGITTTTSYWYSKKHKFTGTTGQASYEFDVSTSWIRVGDFYKYAISHGATATSYNTLSSLQNNAKPGDIVQLKKDGSWYHSIIITGGSKGNRTYCGHTNNWKDRSVSKLTGQSAYRIIRFN